MKPRAIHVEQGPVGLADLTKQFDRRLTRLLLQNGGDAGACVFRLEIDFACEQDPVGDQRPPEIEPTRNGRA